MHKSVLMLLTLLAASASAQTLDRPNRVSLFLSNVAFGWSEGGGSFLDAGYGVAYERRFSRAWSAELAVSVQEVDDTRTHPVDALARWSFPNVRTRWRPYVGAGVRFLESPQEPRNVTYEELLLPEVAAGVDFNPAESWSLRFDVKQVFGDVPEYDDAFKVSAGIGWRF